MRAFMKKKILFITPSLCQGGLEHSLITMLKLLDENKYEMYLYTYSEDLSLLSLVPEYVHFKNDLLNKHYQRNPKAITLWLGETYFSKIGAKKKAKRYTEKRKKYLHRQKVIQINEAYKNQIFDVVVGNSIGITSEMAAVVNAKRRFVFFRSSVDLHHEENTELFPKYDGIIAVSQGVKNMLCSSYSNIEDKLYVLENYVDAEQIIAKANEPLPNGLVPPDNKLILCTCGRFSEEKGFDLAVESASILKKNGVDFIWYFIGDGVLRDALEKQISEYSLKENIVITGYVDNPFPYIKVCDICIQPSYHESYGRTIKEAIILGKPVVSTDTVGAHTLLDNNNYGEIVGISPRAIADGIITASNNIKQDIYEKYDISTNQQEKNQFAKGLESIINR